jgi:alanine racemase
LKAIQENYLSLKGFVRKGALCAAVLKADAYGLGQNAIGDALYKVGCRDFFFAYVDEAIQARKHFPNKNINLYVFNGVLPRTEDCFIEHNLIPCLISKEQVERWAHHAQHLYQKLPCLLHVDTGMGREGLPDDVLKEVVQGDLLENLDIRYIMSHMANSNNSGSLKNKVQLDRFLKARQLLPKTKASLATFANSSGIALGDTYQFDLVRPGMALYGYKNESYSTLLDLKPCLKTFARILLTRHIPKGETLGYNCTHTCHRDTRVALVSVGHRDGILRAASNKGYVLINGKKAPIIGTVSMDVLMADVTDQPESAVHSNMWAEIYGDITSTRDFAENEGTSVYELLVRHGTRYHRIYTS